MSGGIAAVKAEHAVQGKWSGGPRPFGYEAVDGVLRIRESEAARVRAAARAILSGSSTAHVARQWNSAGIAGSGGGDWNSQKVKRVLMRPRNAGLNVHLGVETGTGQWPPILDLDTFRALQVSLAEGTRKTCGPEHRWLGSGLYQCGVCHGPVRAHHVGGGTQCRAPRTVYRCPGHMGRSAVPIDTWIGDLICARLMTAAPLLPQHAQEAPDVGPLQEQITVIRGRLDELARLHQRGDIDGRQLVAGTAQGRRDIASLEERIRTAAAPQPDGPRKTIREWWDDLDVARKRTILAEQMEWVRLMPTGRTGMPAGIRRGEPYFDLTTIAYQWR